MILTIIVPVYNVQEYVERCLSSCVNQNISKDLYEIIVVNDGSTDESLKIVEKFASTFSNIRVISQKNAGLSAARNTGMRGASGRYYMFVDSDDWIKKDCLGDIVNRLQDKEPDILNFCAANVYNDHTVRRAEYDDTLVKNGKDALGELKSPCVPFRVWKASFLKENNLFFMEGIFHEDCEFTPRAFYNANIVAFYNEIIYYVYQNPNSITRTANPKKAFDLVEKVCKSLSVFSETVEDKYKWWFDDNISIYLNNAMDYSFSMNHNDIKMLNQSLCRHRYIFKHLKRSTIKKYRIEGALFNIFKNNPLNCFRFIQKINNIKNRFV